MIYTILFIFCCMFLPAQNEVLKRGDELIEVLHKHEKAIFETLKMEYKFFTVGNKSRIISRNKNYECVACADIVEVFSFPIKVEDKNFRMWKFLVYLQREKKTNEIIAIKIKSFQNGTKISHIIDRDLASGFVEMETEDNRGLVEIILGNHEKEILKSIKSEHQYFSPKPNSKITSWKDDQVLLCESCDPENKYFAFPVQIINYDGKLWHFIIEIITNNKNSKEKMDKAIFVEDLKTVDSIIKDLKTLEGYEEI